MSTSGVKVLTIGHPFKLPYEVKHLDGPENIMGTIASFNPDVIVTSTFHPGVLGNAAFQIRKRWIHVDQNTPIEQVIQAIEGCYSFNIWSKHPNDKANPLISVYTGTWNTGDYLRETFQSLKEQTYKNWEWVVVDDSSSDKTWERLIAMADEDIRVRPFRSGKRLSKIGAVKDTATRLCRGEYLVELDHDDMLTDFALDEIKKAFESDPEIGFVYSNCSNRFEDGSPHKFTDDFWKVRYRETEYRGKKYAECLQPDGWGRFNDTPLGQWFTFLTVGPNHVRAYRKTLLDEIGPYNPNLPVADDFDLYLRAFLASVPPELEGKMKGWKCHLIDKLIYNYLFKDGWTNSTFTRNQSIQDHLALARNNYFEKIKQLNDKRLAAKNVICLAPTSLPVTATNEKPCFVIACRTEEDASEIRSGFLGQDVFVKVGAPSVLEAYEEGRLHWKDRRRVVYIHDDVAVPGPSTFVEMVKALLPGLHGPVGSAAPDALDKHPSWWDQKPLAGGYIQEFPMEISKFKEVVFSEKATEVTWLDGFCLVTVDQNWSWKVSGNPKLWHGYDWLACKRTKLSGGKCFTFPNEKVGLLSHKGYGRTDGLEEAMKTIRVLSKTAAERRDYPNIFEHLPEIEKSAKGVVLELGSREGASTAALLDGVEKNGGEVWSIDIDPAYAHAWEGHPLWNFVGCDSCDVEIMEEIGLPKQLDVLFIDSEHTYERAKKELETWAPRVKPGGLILMHDTESFPDVKRAAREFISAKGLSVEWRLNCNGLAVIRVPEVSKPKEGLERISYVVLEAAPTELTNRCLKSIHQFSPGSEVILVENGCKTASINEAYADQIIHLDVNLGFAAGCNVGAAKATREIIAFCNNDMAFVDDTPAKLLSAITEVAPIVAPYSNRAKPPQGDIPREQTPSKTEEDQDMVVGLCMMLPKNVYFEVGGFDPRFLTYEDDDFCLRAATQGYRCKIVGGAWVDHERHVTFQKLGLDVNEIMRKNALVYKQKNPVVRVIVIAKDEEKSLPGFFAHLSDITDDWCLLDTGSTDNTIQAAKQLGVKVEESKFQDFAQARNEAVKRFGAGADWIIMFDPDERLDAHTLKHLKEFLFNVPADILMAPLEAVYPDGSRKQFVPKPFMWRNKPEIQWAFKVHEKLIGSKAQVLIENAKITHLLELHDDGRRGKASSFYDSLMQAEPYFTDPGYKNGITAEWPILDYDHVDDPRIRKATIGPLVSVVIPTYRRIPLLMPALKSALEQDYVNLEIVIVGDACPELSKIEEFKFQWPRRTRVFNLKSNHGSGGATPRNHGIMAAAGDLIAYLDDDNVWKPNHVSSLYKKLSKSDAAFVFSSMEVDGTDLEFKVPTQGSIDTSCVLHKKELIGKYGPWSDRKDGGYAHDWELINRWMKGVETWASTGLPTLVYGAKTSGQKEYLERLVSEKKRAVSSV